MSDATPISEPHHDDEAHHRARKRARRSWMLPVLGLVLLVILVPVFLNDAEALYLYVVIGPGLLTLAGFVYTVRSWVYIAKHGAEGMLAHTIGGTVFSVLFGVVVISVVWLTVMAQQCSLGLILIGGLLAWTALQTPGEANR